MKISHMKSNLKMEDLYFSKCEITRESSITSGNYDAELKKNIDKIAAHTYDITLTLDISKKDMKLTIIAKARFTYEADDYNLEDSIIKKNTVAIMFPFIRSQVSLLTTQPGMTPIVLPPVNTAKLTDDEAQGSE